MMNKIDIGEAFKKNDVLAYLYPADDSFENTVPGEIEAVVSGRTIIYPGNKKLVIKNACSNEIKDLLNMMNVEINREEIIELNINPQLPGQLRQRAIEIEIQKLGASGVLEGGLVGGQPLLGINPQNYSIAPDLSYYLNLKDNMKNWIPKENLAKEFVLPVGGLLKSYFYDKVLSKLEQEDNSTFWAKLNSSSSGDGVMFVKDELDFKKVKDAWLEKNMPIILQENIDAEKNIGVNIMISPSGRGEIIGYSGQITGKNGEYQGAKIDSKYQLLPDKVEDLLRKKIMPKLAGLGWYGVASLDILIDRKTGIPKVIDPNMRFSASTNFLVDKTNGNVGDKNIIMSSGSFDGDNTLFREKVLPLVQNGIIRILSMARFEEDNKYYFQMGLLYDQYETRKENLKLINDAKVDFLNF